MDINFHYFAIKTIARKAGFDEENAQLIAAYSQFVDDYNIWMNYYMVDVPEYARSLSTKQPYGYTFYTVTTGFTDLLDTARLMIEKYQREVVVPFHFIPWQPLREIQAEERTLLRTQVADITGNALIAQLLRRAKDKYMNEQNPQEKHYDLIRIGVMLHTFADTYAHQRFSGFHGWENFSYITLLQDAVTQENVKDELSPETYAKVYAVGHANVGHAPDMTYAYFNMRFAENKNQTTIENYTGNYSRSNTQVFGDAAKQIFTLLYQICHQNNAPTEAMWDELLQLLKQGFAIRTTKEDELEVEWSRICRDIHYHYNKDELWKDQLVSLTSEELMQYQAQMPMLAHEAGEVGEANEVINEKTLGKYIYRTASDDFFHFNLIAKEIRDAVLN